MLEIWRYIFGFSIISQHDDQGSNCPTTLWPGASKTASQRSRFGQSFLLYHIHVYRWVSGRLQYLQCISNEDTAVMLQIINVICAEKCQILHIGQVKISWYVEPWWHRLLKSFLLEYNDWFVLHSRYHHCWLPGDTRSQCTSDHATMVLT